MHLAQPRPIRGVAVYTSVPTRIIDAYVAACRTSALTALPRILRSSNLDAESATQHVGVDACAMSYTAG